MGNIGYSTLSVLPSSAGFGAALSKGVAPQMAVAGRTSGLAFGKAMLVGMTTVAAVGAVAVGALFKVGSAFDKMSDTIRVGTGATGKILDGLNQSAKNVGKDVPASFGDIGTAIADLNTRTGQSGPGLESLAKQMLEMTRLTGGDLSANIAGVTRVFGDWSIKTGDQSETMDYLFKVSQTTGIGIDSLSTKVVQFGAPLRQLGFDFETSAALLGKWEQEGVNTEAVLAGMKIGLGKMSAAGKEPVKALKDVQAAIMGAGTAGEANAIAIATFGQRAGPDMAAAIREGRFSVGELMGTLKGSKETILGAAKDTEDFAEKWLKFKNNVLIAIEQVATRVFDAFGKGMDWFTTTGGPALAAFGAVISANVMPALTRIGSFVTGTGVPALRGFATWIAENTTKIKVIAGVIGTLLLPVLINMGVQHTITAVKAVAAWVTTSAASVKSAAIQFASHYRIVAGWVASAAAAVVSGAQTVAIWALYQAEALKGAAVTVASHARMAGAWLASKATAVASMAVTVATMVAGWAVMGVQALLGAAKIALAWVISMGPIGIVIAAVVGLGILIWKNMDKIKGWIGGAWNWVLATTRSVWGAVTGFFAGIPAKVSAAIQDVIGFVKKVFGYSPLGLVINNFGAIVSFFKGIPGKILSGLGNLGSLLKNAGNSIISGLLSGITAKFEEVKSFVSGIGSWIADHKGPLSYDRKLLVPAGGAIMGGLNEGLTTGFNLVQGNVASMAGRLSIGSLDFASSATRSAAVAGGDTFNIYEAVSAEATAMQITRRQAALGAV